MGKVNIWVRRSFIGVTSVIAILTLMVFGFMLFSHGFLYRDEEMQQNFTTVHFSYGFFAVLLALVILGGFGVYKEKKWALIVFAVGMILASLIMGANGSIGLAMKSQISHQINKHYLDFLPLTNATETVYDTMDEAQTYFQCCGVASGYVEWGDYIPESCNCTEESTNPCVDGPIGSGLSKMYSKPCLPYIIEDTMIYLQIIAGTILGYTFLLVLSVVLCIVILCQLNVKEETPTVVYSKEAKAGNYSSFTDVLN